MKLQTVWTKAVVMLYLVAVARACLHVPSYMGVVPGGSEVRVGFAYKWVWNLNLTGSNYGSLVDYGRVALEVVGLTAIVGVLFLIGSLVADRRWGKQSDPSTRPGG
jgi:hypothetical protein